MSNRGHIPGYYYDNDKGKYFRIQKASQLPEGSVYSTASVRNRDRDEKLIQQRKLRQGREAKCIQRLLTGSYAYLNLNMRLGARPSSNLNACQAHFAAHLSAKTAVVDRRDTIQGMDVSLEGELCSIVQLSNGDYKYIRSNEPRKTDVVAFDHIFHPQQYYMGHNQFGVLNGGSFYLVKRTSIYSYEAKRLLTLKNL